MHARRIRVLIVDDSSVVRRQVSDTLAVDPEIEVVGTAIDAYAARDKIQRHDPDVVTLDLELPGMSGLDFLRILMEQRPRPVIVLSSMTQSGSAAALEALRLGAFDVLGKPNGPYSFGDLGPQLIARIKATRGARIGRRQPADATSRAAAPPRFPASRHAGAGRRHPRDLILLGASTGGTDALREILPQLPPSLPPIAIVQHIPAVFSKTFADRLNELCDLEVREAADCDRLRPGLALVAPGDFHLLVQWNHDHYRVRLADGPAVWHQRPAIDLLFRSAHEAGAAPHTLAGVLTGMGRDGAEGLLRLREGGATTFAQDESTSVVYGMPRAAWENHAAQNQFRLEHIAESITRHYESDTASLLPQPAALSP